MSTVAARLAAFLPFMDSSRSQSTSQPHQPAAASSGSTLTADEQDIIWMMRVRGGDRGAFEELVECHQGRVVGTVARMLGPDCADAEDVGQQVFLRVWKSAARYEPTAKFTTWLYTITRHLVFNEMRRRKGRPVTSLDAETSGDGSHGGAFGHLEDTRAASPDASLLESELQAAIAAAIAQLPEAQRLGAGAAPVRRTVVRGDRRHPQPDGPGGQKSVVSRAHAAAREAGALPRSLS